MSQIPEDLTPPLRVRKLVPGGQGLAEMAEGKKIFIWNALPNELVRARVIRQKQSFAEGIAEEILESSPERAIPRETNYLATSPWQMMTFAAENMYKKQLVQDIFGQAKVTIPEFVMTANDEALAYGYRNKMEYSFWGDEEGLHLALHQRGSHGKEIVTGSVLAMQTVDDMANNVLIQLRQLAVRAGEMKTIIIRSTQTGDVAASLFVKIEDFPKLRFADKLKGIRVYYSNPRSPASVPTKLLEELGDPSLADNLLGKTFQYDVDSFFQINVPVYELVLQRIREWVSLPVLTDLYAGVGSIGLSIASKAAVLVELDPKTASMARINSINSGLETEVAEASAEKSLDYISNEKPVICDPPRAGLHEKVITRLVAVKPPQIIYLSCNPVTQARDLSALLDDYELGYFEAFNFFPRTPHIETLAILQARR